MVDRLKITHSPKNPVFPLKYQPETDICRVMKEYKPIAVIGGGAAGFFGAVTAARTFPGQEVVLLEKTHKLLSKVKISGGGRCNVTHACYEPGQLVKSYPRGEKSLPVPFARFAATQTVEWFRQRGVPLKTEADGRMFPVTDDSQTVIDCLLTEARLTGVEIRKGWGVASVGQLPEDGGFLITSLEGDTLTAGRVLIATGGNPNLPSYGWLQKLGHHIMPPVPSLFTFNVPDSDLPDLAGISVPEASLKVAGSKLVQNGPLLITHWGFSGPAVLKLSAWGARELANTGYRFTLQINWVPQKNEDGVRADFSAYKEANPKKMVAAHPLYGLPQRLWKRLTEGAEIPESLRWADLPKKQTNRLIDRLVRSTYEVAGKSTFKEEFVTCGGIAAGDINWQTMESRRCPGIYFAGEVMDVDGITGGFNFQNAWTTGYLAGQHIGKVSRNQEKAVTA